MFTLSVCLASFVALASQVSSFTVTPNQRILSSKQPNVATKFQRCGVNTNSVLKAIVFYPEGDDESSDDEDDNEFAPKDLSSELRGRQKDLADKLSSNPTTLAHLASAFSPAGHSINLEQINSVRCTAVDNKHLDIETVLCDDLECNSLLVPIDFPNECTLDSDEDRSSLEDCVMTNVEELDHEWESRLSQTLASATELLHNAPLEFPEWWIPPNTKEDASECELLTDLMNEDDMADERTGLCRKIYNPSKLDDIKSIKVLALGPAGMLLKVVVSGETGGITEDTIPVEFIENTRSIREKVLELLSSAGVN